MAWSASGSAATSATFTMSQYLATPLVLLLHAATAATTTATSIHRTVGDATEVPRPAGLASAAASVVELGGSPDDVVVPFDATGVASRGSEDHEQDRLAVADVLEAPHDAGRNGDEVERVQLELGHAVRTFELHGPAAGDRDEDLDRRMGVQGGTLAWLRPRVVDVEVVGLRDVRVVVRILRDPVADDVEALLLVLRQPAVEIGPLARLHLAEAGDPTGEHLLGRDRHDLHRAPFTCVRVLPQS